MKKSRVLKFGLSIVLLVPIALIVAFVLAGNKLTAPVPAEVGNCPPDLKCENIEFSSASGATLRGWVVDGERGNGAVIVMHGLRSNRTAEIDRVRFLHKSGFSVLAFDFQASGESTGEGLTFGYLESRDATAALKLARQRFTGEKIGVIGISMGGAAFLLQDEPESADALILEMVYPTIRKAIENRLNLWLFRGADILAPLMTLQFPLRIGVSVDELRPLDRINDFKCPKLLIAGENDRHTTLEESKQLFEKSDQPKELWIVPNAEHTDLYKIAPREYEQKVTAFFAATLRGKN